MSAERGWIADPPPQQEHHTPGWLSEKGTGRSHFHILPDGPLTALNILREVAGLEPLPEDEKIE